MGCVQSKKKAGVAEPDNKYQPGLENNTTSVVPASPNLKIDAGAFIGEKAGKITDTYQLGKKLGDGAFGCVRLATHKVNPNIVRAVKTLSKASVEKAEERDKLFAEVSVLRHLDHPNIMKLYEFYEDAKHYHLVMEYYSGGELFDKIVEMAHFSEGVAADVMKQLLSGVAYCHSKKIVHRDLKPENLLLENKERDAPIKIIDFGTSRMFDPEKGTKMHQKLGTPYYVAPEVLRKTYNEKCDVWSSGVILYVMISGYPPFGGGSDEEILNKVRAGQFQMESEDWKRVSKGCKDLIKQLLTYDPKKRITAEKAMNDTWVQTLAKKHGLSDAEGEKLTGTLKNLKNFRTNQRLQHAALTFIASQLTSKEERSELTKAFKSIDTNGDGTLSKEELIANYVKVLGDYEAAVEEVESILKVADADGSGAIDYTEFIVATMDRKALVSIEKLEAAFKTFDIDGSGKITSAELGKIFGVQENKFDRKLWDDILKETDRNGDGEVDLVEFKAMMIKLLK